MRNILVVRDRYLGQHNGFVQKREQCGGWDVDYGNRRALRSLTFGRAGVYASLFLSKSVPAGNTPLDSNRHVVPVALQRGTWTGPRGVPKRYPV